MTCSCRTFTQSGTFELVKPTTFSNRAAYNIVKVNADTHCIIITKKQIKACTTECHKQHVNRIFTWATQHMRWCLPGFTLVNKMEAPCEATVTNSGVYGFARYTSYQGTGFSMSYTSYQGEGFSIHFVYSTTRTLWQQTYNCTSVHVRTSVTPTNRLQRNWQHCLPSRHIHT